MARLIPRKQIEEQQNITGSLEIGQDLFVGNNSFVANDSVISGSLDVKQNFFLGDQLTDRGEITGSVFLTGSLEINGQLILDTPDAVLSVTSSQALFSQDTLRYEGIRAKDFGANVPTLYVSSTDGDDTNDGRTIQFPLKTIKRAAQLAQPGYDGRYGFDTGSIFNGYVIKVQAGTYLEDNPVILPSNTTIWGSGLRITKVNAQNPEQDLFWVNSGCYIAEITMGGLRLWPDEKEPQRGFGVAFQPGAFITTSPYIQNCSQISNQENSFTELYEDIPPGGGGLYVNGDAVDPNSPLASMVLDAYTQISPNGVGCLVNGRGFIQLVSFFTNFSYYAIRVNNGGHATLNNSNISFGLFGMYASGSRFISGSGGNIDARNRVRASYSVIVDVLNKGLDVGLPLVTTKNTAAGIRATSVSEHPQIQISSEIPIDTNRANELVSDFELVSQIVDSGTSDFPSLIAKSSTKGYSINSPYNILGATQITSSISASLTDLDFISSSYGAILDIFNDGTASYQFVSNTSSSIKVTDTVLTPIQTPADYSSSLLVSSSFVNIYSILEGGISRSPRLISNNSASIKVTDVPQFLTGFSSSLAVRNSVSASFSIVYNILANGTGSSILDIPQNHQKVFTIAKSDDNTKYTFDISGSGNVENAPLTLFRGETYRFFVSAGLGPDAEPFFIRKQPISGFDYQNIYNYNNGVINNGDSNGTITFQVPFDAPNKLYYISQDTPSFVGDINIYNSSTTPKELIFKTLTYPIPIQSSSFPSTDVDKINAYDLLIENKDFIKAETIEFVSSSWSGIGYNEASCSRDVGFIIDGVAKDLKFGGNEESIRSGLFYYQFPSEATTTQLDPTLTAIRYVAGMAQRLLENKTFVDYDNDKFTIAESIRENKLFVQNETIAYLSSSWSTFEYNETKCKRDIGYILDAVATDLVYGGNERAINAGVYYYLYPSLATVSNITTGQLNQTLDGIKYAAGTTLNIITGSTFVTQSESRVASAQLLIDNKSLIQNESIQFINVQYPSLNYNTDKCRRDVGYIIDAVATDLIYGGNESSTRAGNFYYQFPSVATTTQRRETRDGFLYSKVIGEFIVQNIILDTPRIITNDERFIKVTNNENVTSSFSGTDAESSLISSSFAIIQGIVRRGTSAIPSVLALNNGQNWNINNPINVSGLTQITSETSSANLTSDIDSKYAIVTKIIDSGSLSAPAITSSINGLIKVTSVEQITGSAATQTEANFVSSSFATVVRIITNGTGSIPPFVSNTSASIKVTNSEQYSGSVGTQNESNFISSSIVTITNIIENGLNVVPTFESNTSQSIKVTDVAQISSSLFFASSSDITFVSQSISYVTDIITFGTGSAPTASLYTTPTTSSNIIGVYNLLKQNIPFIQNETIAYLSSSWAGFEFNEVSCSRDIGLIISGAAEDLYWNTNSASIVNGKFYLEYPSEATSFQLNQTIDGIKYASRIAQKLIQNIKFVKPTNNVLNASTQLLENRAFIQSESIAYLSSSWGEFDYNDQTCKRDIGYIIDAVRTDLVYGGNERSITAGEYYYLYPSEATGSQLIQTLDGVNYASRIAQKVVRGVVFETASLNQLNANFLLERNKELVSEEVVAYVSSSWFGIPYNETKCKRDVKYIIDAVRTDLVYGGNERTRLAGEFYYRFPSAATIGGVPSVSNQLDPTVTGIEYGSNVAQKIVLGNIFVTALNEALNVSKILQKNRDFIKAETIEYISAFYPSLVYNEASCSRDVGFILDAVSTDILYGGNERSVIAGDYYYRFPSVATSISQKSQTIDSINYSKNIVKKVVSNDIIENSEFVLNTDGNIKVSAATQFTASVSASTQQVNKISSSFEIVTDIIENGIETLPTIISNVEELVKVNNIPQITSSISGGDNEVGLISSSFKLIRDIIYNGSTSIPDSLASNYDYGFSNETPTPLHITSITQSLGDGSQNVTSLIGSVSSSYGSVKNIITNGTGSIPTLIGNTSASIKVSGTNEVSTGLSGSQSEINKVGNLFGIVLNIIENGTSVIPTLLPNNTGSIKVTDVPQFISGSASRLQGRIVSASIGLVIDTLLNNGTSSIQYREPSATPNSNTNVVRAYNLLINNIPFIQAETVQFMSSSWSTFVYNETSCSRDVGLIVSGAAFDLLYGGNSASFVNGRFYFDFPSEATSSQLDQTVTAIRYASGVAERIINGNIFTSITSSQLQPISASYELLRKNKGFIQSESIAYLSSSWSEFEYSQSTCVRDIGYIIDAVSTDLLYGGNERSIVAGDYYYRFPSTATTAQLEPTLTGIRHARGLSMEIVSGSTFQTPSAQVDYAYDIIKDNKLFIQSESIAFVNAKFPHFVYNEETCKRDLGYIVDAVITDLKWGGNERTNKAGEFYYLFPSEATGVQVEETTAAVNYARLLTEQIMLNNLIAEPQPILNTIGLIKKSSTNQYISSSINSESGSSYEASLISASISIVTNIIRNGTGSIATPVDYTTPTTASNVYYAYNLVKQNLEFIQNETIAYLSSSWSTASYDEAKCKRDIGFIVSGAIEDVLFGVNSASLVNGKFYWEFPSEANGTGSQIQQTLDGIFYASRLAQNLSQNKVYVTASLEVSASYELLRNNREFIQSESISFISSSWDGFQYNQTTCMRDITHIIDAVSTDLFYGGNERGVIAGDYYFRFPSTATTTQLDPTATGIEYAGKLASKLVKNQIFETASLDDLTIRQLIRDNRPFIQDETMAYLTASWSTFDYDKVKCRRDVGYIVDAAATDLLYGGNERSVIAGKFYYLFPSLATVAGTTNGQLEETIDGIRYASRVAQKVVQNTLFVTASAEVSASFDLLRKNKPFIQAETIAYVSSSWSSVYYNEASCSRDVGFLIDAAATDLLYGGQERSVTAGSFYYLFPSRATNAGVPSEQNQLDPTITGITYAGRLSSRVIQNPTYQLPSSSVNTALGLLLNNKRLIQKETITFLSSSWSTLKYNEISCSRDLGFIIDAAATDLIYGGNERSIEAGSIYYRIPSVAIVESYTDNGEVGQKKQTVDGINFAKGITEKIVNNITLTPPTTRIREAAQRLLGSKEILKQQAIGYTNGAFPYLAYNEASCSRDTGLIVDALVTDLVYGGNERGIAAASSYFNGQFGSAATVINAQRTETLETNRYLRTKAEFIAAGAPLESFGSLIVATGIDYSYNGSGVTFKALPPNQGGSGVPNPTFEITELGGGRIFFTSGNQDGDFRIGTGLSINQATGTLVGRTFSKSLFSLVTPFSLALEG